MNQNLRTKKSKKATMVLLSFLFLVLGSVSSNSEVIDSETCLGCHDGLDKTLYSTAHRLSSSETKARIEVNCVSCHSGAATHIEDPTVDNIGNPARAEGHDAVKLCSECHIAHVELDNFGFDAHNNQQLNCSSCHKVHTTQPELLLDNRAAFCTPCHSSVMNDFSKRSNHPVRQGNLTCLNCHQFARRSNDNLTFDLNRVCQECHPSQGGPHLYEHEPVNAYSVEGSGCVECHSPHGSNNDHLLAQKGNQLCESCHFLPGHQIAHGGLYEPVDCRTCHTEIHGSYVSNLFLDPALPAKFGVNCFDCHSLNK